MNTYLSGILNELKTSNIQNFIFVWCELNLRFDLMFFPFARRSLCPEWRIIIYCQFHPLSKIHEYCRECCWSLLYMCPANTNAVTTLWQRYANVMCLQGISTRWPLSGSEKSASSRVAQNVSLLCIGPAIPLAKQSVWTKSRNLLEIVDRRGGCSGQLFHARRSQSSDVEVQ